MYLEKNSTFSEFSTLTANLPPQNIEAEEAILGGLMLDPNAYLRVADILEPEAFYLNAHKDIYNAVRRLHELNRPTDLLQVVAFLEDHDQLKRVGGRNKLATLLDRCVSAVNINALAHLVVGEVPKTEIDSLRKQNNRTGIRFYSGLGVMH